MNKYNIVVEANDGRKFYQNFHVIAVEEENARQYLLANFPNPKIKSTVKITQSEKMESAEMMLPGIVYTSGVAYFE